MAISIRKNPSGARSRKKRENLLMKQLQRLEEIQRQEEEARKLEEERRREAERAKRREEELRLEELRLQEMLLREMDRMRLRTDRKRGKRLWTAEERMAQRVFAAALMETAAASAAAHQAEQSGYAEGRMEVLSAGGGKPGSRQAASTARERQPELVTLQGGLVVKSGRDVQIIRSTGCHDVQGKTAVDGSGASLPKMLKREASAAQPHVSSSAVQFAKAPAGRRRTAGLRDRRMRCRPARSPCLDSGRRGSARNKSEEVAAERE